MYIFGNGGRHRKIKTTGTINEGNQPIRIGGGAPGLANKYFFNGQIDDIRIYNRALSEAEVAELYEQENLETWTVKQPSIFYRLELVEQ